MESNEEQGFGALPLGGGTSIPVIHLPRPAIDAMIEAFPFTLFGRPTARPTMMTMFDDLGPMDADGWESHLT